MPADRFDKLEGSGAPAPLPDQVKDALSNLGRFDHLEIGAKAPEAPAAHTPEERALCSHCGQWNEKQRATCWACFQPLSPAPKAAPKGPQDITIVLDGVTYKSTDKDLPPDVKVLMDQIREKGFSDELLAQWRSWRATRNEPLPAEQRAYPDPSLVPVENQGKDPLTGNEVFKGQRSAVIRLDGKLYQSTDKDLSPQMKELFNYIERNGVTPELMEHLRQVGRQATVRPSTTTTPSQDDVDFWKDVCAKSPLPPRAPQEELDPAGDDDKRRNAALILAVCVVLYVILRLIF